MENERRRGRTPEDGADGTDAVDGSAARTFGPSTVYTAARMHYEDGLSQQQVSERLSIHRTTVSRILQVARETGVVRIQVVRPDDVASLSEELAAALGLRRAVVVDSGGGRGPSAARVVDYLVEPARRELAALGLPPGASLGVSWGEAVGRVASAQGGLDLTGVDLVPVVGGMDEVDPRFQVNEIVRRLGASTGANVNFLHLPARLSPSAQAVLLDDATTAARLARWDRLDAVLVGIGIGGTPTDGSVPGPLALAGEQAYLSSAVGDVAARHFTLEGEPVLLPDEDWHVAITREQLRRTGTVVAVAAGAAKVRAITGAARAALVDVVVTDAPTARSVLDLVEGRRETSDAGTGTT